MADIALTTAARIEVVESTIQATLPSVATIVAGAPVRIDSAGKFTNALATTAANANAYGIATHSCIAGEALTAVRVGVLDGYVLTGAYGSAIYLSDTSGRVADAAGTVELAVGFVIPGWSQLLGTAADKLFAVDFTGASAAALGTSVLDTFSITTDLMAASVDKWVWVAPQACLFLGVDEIHSVAGGASAAARFRKVTAASTEAPGAAASATCVELAAACDLTTAANTVQSPTITAAAAARTFAALDKVGVDMSGTLTALVGHATLNFRAL